MKPDPAKPSPESAEGKPADVSRIFDTGEYTLGPEEMTIAVANPSRQLPAATYGPKPGTFDNTVMGDAGGPSTMPSQGGLPMATGPSPTGKAKSHMEALTGNDGWIGDRYRLLDKLGEGGFGLVYRAEQVKPLHRLVAIKILKAGVTSEDILGRFAIERQTLAIMEHPNIAKVLDAGETDMGAPFFAMELVKGRSITTYCRQNDYNIPQRLALFIDVCHAVHHAHQKGIIHRDLKPGNILVADEDGKAVPKVIDFGIAKVLEGEGSGHTLATGLDQLVGTPGYISPELIEHGSAHIDTRSDVYALGSILFELICGKTLITPSDLAQKPIHVLLREIAERDAPKPSTIEPNVKGDLDWIVLKALERDPNRRYGSADDLADDITRYLKHEPIVARPPSSTYLVSRFVRRHRVGVAAVAAIAFAIIAGGITSTALYLEAEKNRLEAEAGREGLRKSYSRSDEQMGRERMDNGQHADAVAYLARSLRTDPANDISSTNLLALLANVHLIRPDKAALMLPEGATEAAKVAISQAADVGLAVSRLGGKTGRGTEAELREVVSTWDMKTGRRTDHPMPPGVQVTCLEVTPDGQSAVIGRDDGGVELWSLKDGKRRTLQPQMANLVTCVAFSGNSEKLVVGSEIGEDGAGGVQAWDLRKPEEPARVMKQKQGAVGEIAVDHEGVFAASIFGGDLIDAEGADGAANTWDLRSGTLVGDPIVVDKGLLHVAIEPRQEILALGMNNGTIFVGSFRNGGEVLPPISHSSTITSLAFSADGNTFITGDNAGYVQVWSLEDGKPRYQPIKHAGEILKATPATDSSLLTSISRQGDVCVFDVQTGAQTSARLQHTVRDGKMTSDGSLLILAPRGVPAVQVWNIHERMTSRRFVDVLEKNLITRIKGPDGSSQQLRESDAGGANRQKSLYAAADPDGTVFVYDAKTLKVVGAPFYHPPAVGAVTVSMDGKFLITSGRDREVRVWDIETHKNVVSMRHDALVVALALSPDDERLVTVTEEAEVRVWNFRTGDRLTPGIRDTPILNRDQESIVVARVSDDGKTLLYRASGGFFSVPMPPKNTVLPEWFLKFAEALARRKLAPDGHMETLEGDDFETAAAAIPRKAAKGEETALLWAHWLLEPAKTRPLSPFEDTSFDEYLRSLKAQGSPAAAAEYVRYYPNDRSAAERAAKLVPTMPE